ncbi:MFS transporter [Alicyclobacillus fastidiosus]|uniref:MFS transporter n=1 Tax=Alicyclobacillus fastidiosus TaxID=392011 RepID=A0ABV5ABT9_9BACL|nr:MFS transporter [Alicyclobacillus fastidiosus]WEH10344.1 MFS transporter [Alicyclobacillus fastidiosus]
MLKNRNFLTLFVGQLISTFGNNLFAIALPWYVYSITQSKADLSYVGIAQSIPSLLSLFAGVFIDRWRKRTTMVTADLLRMALCLTLAGLCLKHASLLPMVILVFVMESVGSFFNPASGALLPLIVSKEEIPTATGVAQSGNATVQLLGTLSGGALLSIFSAPFLFIGDAISFLGSVVCLSLLRLREQRSDRPASRQSHFWREFREGISIFQRSRFLLFALFCALIANFGMAPFDISLTVWVKGPLHGTSLQLAIINGAFFLGVVTGGIVLGQMMKLFSMRVLFSGSLMLAGLLICLVGKFPNIYVDATLTLIAGFVIGTLNGAASSVFVSNVPERLRGRVMGTIGALFPMAMPLGMAFGGFLLTHVPLANVFLWMGGLSILSGVPFLFPIRDDLADALSSLSIVSDGSSASLDPAIPTDISRPTTPMEDTLSAE